MNDLIRPSLYGAWQNIVPVEKTDRPGQIEACFDVVGPVCESGDFLGKGRLLKLKRVICSLCAPLVHMDLSWDQLQHPRTSCRNSRRQVSDPRHPRTRIIRKLWALENCRRIIMRIQFTKMHGLGNDFLVIDAVSQHVCLRPSQVHRLADRHTGVGFDQLLLIEPPSRPDADFDYRIFNSDGGEVEHCGNGARCLA